MSNQKLMRLSVFALVGLTMGSAAQAQVQTVEGEVVSTTLDTQHVQRYEVSPIRQLVPGGAVELPPIQWAVDGADDPAGLLQAEQMPALQALAAELSLNRSWLRPEMLAVMKYQDLRLDEIFTDAPHLVRVEQDLYRVQIEKVGSQWENFNADVDPYIVFFSHEIYDGLGEDRALAYMDGGETVIFEADFATTPALALTLVKLSPEERVSEKAKVQPVTEPLNLGTAELRISLSRLPLQMLPQAQVDFVQTMTDSVTCSPEVAPTSCASGKPVCASGYTPYFITTSLMIKTDHEGCCFKGNPEIELYPLRLDVSSPAGSTAGATTTLQFDGRTVTDISGRSRYLPDINNTNTWYNISGGLATFPPNNGLDWSALLVEDDDDAGVLRVDRTKVNVTKLFKTLQQIIMDYRQIDFFYLVKTIVQLIDILGIFNDGDDLYQESIGVANNLFCAQGVGQPFPKIFHLISQEWEMKGYFACYNPTCTPPPPPPPPPGGGGGTCLVLDLGAGDGIGTEVCP